MGAQVVFVVCEQFVEACLCDAGQFDFSFLAYGGCGAAFDDVLLAASCGLDHLVYGSVAESREESFAERPCAEEDGFAFPVCCEFAASSVGEDDLVCCRLFLAVGILIWIRGLHGSFSFGQDDIKNRLANCQASVKVL